MQCRDRRCRAFRARDGMARMLPACFSCLRPRGAELSPPRMSRNDHALVQAGIASTLIVCPNASNAVRRWKPPPVSANHSLDRQPAVAICCCFAAL